MLFQFRYSLEDICCTLAHASSYFPRDQTDGGAIDGHAGNVLVVLIFIAHCWCHDDAMPLRQWHRRLFRKRCTIRALNMAVSRLLSRLNYRLRMDDFDLTIRIMGLKSASQIDAI
eukprot:CAMPEP_0170578180 /NCGR_PEP_ID=MMETSP0224-20130122/5320_1 /TAXON_ID=285029 /ORGANISM="Togula jolla, Strain CCCM 725" /LENGTH=114 /DNA_ID=CAMNT_0010901135 /DNA_START=234 /DNA_END=578 /DNA_ORIENTATION=+